MSTDHRVRARDRGIRRVSVLTRWTIGGGLALSGVFSVLAERQFTEHIKMAAARAAASPVSAAADTSGGSGTITPTLPDVPTTVPPLAPPTTAPRSLAAPSGASTARQPVATTRPVATPRTTVHVPTTVRPVIIIPQPKPRPIVVSGGS